MTLMGGCNSMGIDLLRLEIMIGCSSHFCPVECKLLLSPSEHMDSAAAVTPHHRDIMCEGSHCSTFSQSSRTSCEEKVFGALPHTSQVLNKHNLPRCPLPQPPHTVDGDNRSPPGAQFRLRSIPHIHRSTAGSRSKVSVVFSARWTCFRPEAWWCDRWDLRSVLIMLRCENQLAHAVLLKGSARHTLVTALMFGFLVLYINTDLDQVSLMLPSMSLPT